MIIIENDDDDDDDYTYRTSHSKTDVAAMMMATRVKAGLIVDDRKKAEKKGKNSQPLENTYWKRTKQNAFDI